MRRAAISLVFLPFLFPAAQEPVDVPPRPLATLGSSLFRAHDEVHAVAFSPDGKKVVGVGPCGVYTWEAATGRRLSQDRLSEMSAPYLSPDAGKVGLLYPGSPDDLAAILETSTGRRLFQAKVTNGPRVASEQAYWPGLELGPDGQSFLAVGSKKVDLWSVPGQRCRYSFPRSEGWNLYARPVFSPDGRLLASNDSGRTVTIRDVPSGRELCQFKAVRQHLIGLAFMPDGKSLIVSGFNGDGAEHVLAWHDAATGKEQRRIPDQGGTQLLVSPNGKLLAFREGREIVLLDLTSEKVRGTYQQPDRWARGMAFSPDSRTLAVAVGNTVELLDTETNRPRLERTGHHGAVVDMVWLPDSSGLVTSCSDGTIWCVWDVTTGKGLTLSNPKSTAGEGYAPVTTFIRAGMGAEVRKIRSVQVDRFDARNGKPLDPLPLPTPASENPGRPSHRFPGLLSPTGDLYVYADKGKFHVWDLNAGRVVRSFGEGIERGDLLEFSPDGTLLLGRPGNVKELCWEVATGKELFRLVDHGGSFRGWFTRPDGSPGFASLVSTEAVDIVIVREGRTGVELARIPWPRITQTTETGQSVFYNPAHTHPCGRADCHDPEKARFTVFDLNTGKRLGLCAGPDDWVPQPQTWSGWFLRTAFSADGRLVAAIGADGRLHLWEAATGTELRVWPKQDFPFATPLVYSPLVFSPDGRKLAVGGSLATIWDVTGRHGKAAPSADAVAGLVADLNADDGRAANAAVWALIDAKAADPLRPAAAAVARARKLVADLDADEPATREAAEKALPAEPLAEPVLRRALQAKPSVDAKRRIEALLPAVESRAWAWASRVCAVLEGVATPEARAVLGDLAKGDDGSRLTIEARASLRRLARPKP